MTFTSWKPSYRKVRFHLYEIKCNSKVFCKVEKHKRSNLAIFRRHWLQAKDLRCMNPVTPTWKSEFSSQLCVNMFTEMHQSHWLKKNLMQNEGFHNYSSNKICVWLFTRHLELTRCNNSNSYRNVIHLQIFTTVLYGITAGLARQAVYFIVCHSHHFNVPLPMHLTESITCCFYCFINLKGIAQAWHTNLQLNKTYCFLKNGHSIKIA